MNKNNVYIWQMQPEPFMENNDACTRQELLLQIDGLVHKDINPMH